jgi:soluble lytic murein transglycosylase-like protein
MKINTLLLAISLVESDANDAAIGKSGERGRYQITARTWRQHSPYHHHNAHNAVLSRQVATKHIEWIVKNLHIDKRQNPFYVAAAWNAGLRRKNRAIPESTMAYAKRVTNIYWALHGLEIPE